MKVKELRELLEELDDDMIVVMSSDGEGNNYSPLYDGGECTYVAETTYSGEVYDENDEEAKEGVDALVLWPTN